MDYNIIPERNIVEWVFTDEQGIEYHEYMTLREALEFSDQAARNILHIMRQHGMKTE